MNTCSVRFPSLTDYLAFRTTAEPLSLNDLTGVAGAGNAACARSGRYESGLALSRALGPGDRTMFRAGNAIPPRLRSRTSLSIAEVEGVR